MGYGADVVEPTHCRVNLEMWVAVVNSCRVLDAFDRDNRGSDCDTAPFETIRSLLLVAAYGNLTAIWFKRNLRIFFLICWEWCLYFVGLMFRKYYGPTLIDQTLVH